VKIQNRFQKPGVMVSLAILCTLLWGSAFPCIKTGYRLFQIPSEAAGSQMLFAGVRFTIAGIMTIVFSLFADKEQYRAKGFSKRNISGILLVGLLQTCLQYVFYYIGMAHVTGVKGAILNGTSAFLSVLTARLFYKSQEKLSKGKLMGCIIGLLGVVIINLGKGELGDGFSFLGEGFMLIAAIASALGALTTKEVSKGIEPVTLCGWQLSFGGGLLIIIGNLMGGELDWQKAGGMGIALMAYMSFLSAAAFGIWTILLKYNRMGQVTVFKFLIPVFGTILSALFLGDNIWNPYILSSLPLVCVGIYLVNFSSSRNNENER